jgi:pimeloyl-ACP methyl ester carboxylesterase
MKLTPVYGALVLLLQSATSAAGDGSADHLLWLEDVEVRSGVSADISVTVFVNERCSRCSARGRSLLALPGIGFTAASWEPMAAAMFAKRNRRTGYCQLYAIDPPGHGNSGLPQGMAFGDMTLLDLLTAYRNTWQRLAEMDVTPRAVMGHSQGALLTQLLQDRLLDEGSSLRAEFGAREALLLGASPPAAIEWSAATPELFALLSSLVTWTPERGTFAVAPPEAWVGISYTNFSGVPHPATPLAQLAEYTSPESIPSVLELFGFAGAARPEVRRGIFEPANGTLLTMVAFTEDPFALVPEQEELYEYLTNDAQLRRLAVVEDEFSVHNLHNAEPELILDAIARLNR